MHDIDAAIAELREHDVKVEDWHEIPEMVRLSTFYDPDGTPWMLAQTLDGKEARLSLACARREPVWHVSDDGSIRRFEPRANPEHDSAEALVWAIDDEHVPAYWFPRDCPRGDVLGDRVDERRRCRALSDGRPGRRVHAIQSDWLEAFRSARLRLPAAGETFEPYARAAGYWVSREAVEPLR